MSRMIRSAEHSAFCAPAKWDTVMHSNLGKLQDMLHGFSEPSAAVYVITCDETGLVKIGLSKSPGKRNGDIQVSNGSNTAIYWAIRLIRSDAKKVERFIHNKLKGSKWHRRGEWYEIKPSEAVWFIKAVIKKFGLRAVPDVEFGFGRGLRNSPV